MLGEFLGALKELGDKLDAASKRAQASLALQLCDMIAGTTKLDAPLIALSANLYGLAVKSTHVDKAHLKNVRAGVARKAKALGKGAEGKGYVELLSRLQALNE